LLAHLKISRCHAVGFALGGQIVQAMAIARPDLVATLTIAASGAGTKTLAGGQRSLSPDTEREIHAIGFERYIRNYIENDTMAFNPKFTANTARWWQRCRMPCGRDRARWKCSAATKTHGLPGTR
jgi:pimeloyl-ACP methyl ester carboxylesterase